VILDLISQVSNGKPAEDDGTSSSLRVGEAVARERFNSALRRS